MEASGQEENELFVAFSSFAIPWTLARPGDNPPVEIPEIRRAAMCKSILAFPTVRATVAVHPSQGGYPVDRLLTDRVCDIRRGHVVDPFFRLRSWWGDAHHSRLSETLDILIGEPQQFRQTTGIYVDRLQAALEKVDFNGDSEQNVVRVFKPLAEPRHTRSRTAGRWFTRLPICFFPGSFLFVLTDPTPPSGSA